MDDLLKSKSSVIGHEYDVCKNGCKLFGVQSNEEACPFCGEARFKTNFENQLITAPQASMKAMSIGDVLAQKLANPSTRELLMYRSQRESIPGVYSDIFDGENYRDMQNRGFFENPLDIAIGLYTDGFVTQHKGKSSYTIVHVIVYNLDPSIR